MRRKDILDKTFDKVVEYFGHYHDNDEVAFVDRDRFIAALYNEIGFHSLEPAWIRVKDRLPEDKTLCLVTRKPVDGNMFTSEQVELDYWRVNERGTGGWLKFNSAWEVTAWMPIPDPYGGGKK